MTVFFGLFFVFSTQSLTAHYVPNSAVTGIFWSLGVTHDIALALVLHLVRLLSKPGWRSYWKQPLPAVELGFTLPPAWPSCREWSDCWTRAQILTIHMENQFIVLCLLFWSFYLKKCSWIQGLLISTGNQASWKHQLSAMDRTKQKY